MNERPPADPRPATWVLLRGLTREAGHWEHFVPTLRDALAPCAVLTPDLPGNGARWAVPSPTRVEGYVAALREELRALGAAPPYRLLGMSLGGMVALAWTYAWPHEIERLVLVNTSLRGLSPLHHRLRPAAWPSLLRMALPGLSALEQERRVLRLTSQAGPDARRALLAHWVSLRQAHPVSRANALRQLLAAARFRLPPAAPPVPVLVLGSRGDRLVSPACSEALARRWRCAFMQHPDAGHDLPLDDAAWVARQMQAWRPAER